MARILALAPGRCNRDHLPASRPQHGTPRIFSIISRSSCCP